MTAQFHLFLPQMRMSFDALVERAKAAERSGFEGLALMDHLVPPGAEQHDMWEAMTAATWVLANTDTLTLGHLVLCDSLRHPAVLARQAVSLDHASRGRFELGIGWGSVASELETFGLGSTDSTARVGRLAETLDILDGLWSGEPVSYRGDHFTLDRAQQRPRPTRSIPVIVGGTGRRTMELVAKHATWWNVPMHQLDRLDERRPQAGSARVSVQLMIAYIDDESRREEISALTAKRFGPTGMGSQLILGNAAEIGDRLDALRDRGVERFYVWFTDFADPATLEAFGRDVIEPTRTATT
jgi:alkanesulfonate monooxygenase SsuD/methylene tetrahydromethanopterin reductase-like flavin-dependent oxidoreductase (luciferase family)